MKTSSAISGLLSLVLALGGVACDPIIAGSSADPPATTTTPGAGGGGGDSSGEASAGPIVKAITVNGSGCRDAGSASVTVAPQGGAFLVTYTSMALTYSPGTAYQHLNCAVGITLEGTAGRRLAVIGSTQRGAAHLPAGASGTLTPSYSFAGNPVGFDGHAAIDGPYDQQYALTDTVSTGTTLESTCGEDTIFTIDTSLNLSAMSNASMDVAGVEVAFTWAKC